MRLGKNQLALLLIVEQSTREVAGELVGVMFTHEQSLRYTRLDGESDTFFMMTRDLRSLDRLVDRGLVRRHPIAYSHYHTITDAGRKTLTELRTQARR